MHVTDELISKCRKGKYKAQVELYKQCYSPFMQICKRYLKDHSIAGEVLNDAYMKVIDNLHRFETGKPFFPWANRICVNTVIDYLRKLKRQPFVLDINEYHGSDSEDKLKSFSKASKEMDAEAIYSLIAALPERMRIVFNMFAIEGYSHKEIGEKMDISEGTSKWYLNQARTKLQEQLSVKKTSHQR